MDNFTFKKSLGQNFLIDNNIKHKIVNSANITDDSLIIEVGPGSGSITKLLVSFNVPVIAFEIDTRLKEELDKINASNLTVIYEDFLKVDLDEILKPYKNKKIHLIANLPYYITTPIISKVINYVDEMIIMVQKEVGDRFKALPGTKDYNSLSIFLQYYFDISKVTIVSKNSFVPKPRVDSIVLKFEKHNKYKANNEELFFKLVKDSFKFKRKTLRNNLKDYNIDMIESYLKIINKDLSVRAEALSIEDFINISNELNK